jgi:hypothetical protein
MIIGLMSVKRIILMFSFFENVDKQEKQRQGKQRRRRRAPWLWRAASPGSFVFIPASAGHRARASPRSDLLLLLLLLLLLPARPAGPRSIFLAALSPPFVDLLLGEKRRDASIGSSASREALWIRAQKRRSR